MPTLVTPTRDARPPATPTARPRAPATRELRAALGNQAMLRRAAATPRPCGGVPAQAITMSTPSDAREREADALAERVVAGGAADPPVQVGATAPAAALHRECATCEEKERAGTHVMRADDGGGAAAAPVQMGGYVRGLAGTGQALPAPTRAFFEARFGRSLDHVRVHADAPAAAAARDVHARAFTIGRHVVFGAGRYDPARPDGQRLLAHELTHVVQDGARAEHDGGAHLQRACLTPAEIATPMAGCTTAGAGGAQSFQAREEAREARARSRRRGMATPRQRETGHMGPARQLENFLTAQAPTVRAQIHGIFIDADVSPDTWGYLLPAPCHVDTADARQQIAGAVLPCVFIHGELNRQAAQFNSGAAAIGTQTREAWRIDTVAGFTHELQHHLFVPASVPAPVGLAAGCPRSSVESEISELNAIMVEFHVVRAALAANPDAVARAARMREWFRNAITNCRESIAGTLRAMRRVCECADVNLWVNATFAFVTSGWTAAERAEFNAAMHDPAWTAWHLDWPIP